MLANRRNRNIRNFRIFASGPENHTIDKTEKTFVTQRKFWFKYPQYSISFTT